MSNYGFCDLLEGYAVCLSEVIFSGMSCPHSDHFVGVYHIFVYCVCHMALYFVWLIFYMAYIMAFIILALCCVGFMFMAFVHLSIILFVVHISLLVGLGVVRFH